MGSSTMMGSGLAVPVALLIYKRPEKTARVLEAIAKARPKVLYVIADGPRNDEEGALCRQARTTIEDVPWDCEVRTCFSDTNLGCGRRVSSGLDWVFSQEEEAIIVEDDCLPNQSFFWFCQKLLEKYKNDPTILHIGGNNYFSNGEIKDTYTYYFSKYTHIWGWATWRRAWQQFDYEMKDWPEFKRSGRLSQFCSDPLEKNFWMRKFDEIYKGHVDTWDYQWLFACWQMQGNAIVPCKNLVTNIGFDSAATHTTGEHHSANLPSFEISEIVHPPGRDINREADQYTFEYHFGGYWIRQNQTLKARARRYASKMKQKAKSLVG